MSLDYETSSEQAGLSEGLLHCEAGLVNSVPFMAQPAGLGSQPSR